MQKNGFADFFREIHEKFLYFLKILCYNKDVWAVPGRKEFCIRSS